MATDRLFLQGKPGGLSASKKPKCIESYTLLPARDISNLFPTATSSNSSETNLRKKFCIGLASHVSIDLDEPEKTIAEEPIAGGEPETIAGGEPETIAGGEPETIAGSEPETIAGSEPETIAGEPSQLDDTLGLLVELGGRGDPPARSACTSTTNNTISIDAHMSSW